MARRGCLCCGRERRIASKAVYLLDLCLFRSFDNDNGKRDRQRGSSSTTTPTKTGSGELALGLYGERQGGHGGGGLRDVEKGKRSRGTRKASSVRNAVWSSAVRSVLALWVSGIKTQLQKRHLVINNETRLACWCGLLVR